jgi:three-Cys-motif partner protein
LEFDVGDVYEGREQTGAKHYILERYLQELVFKILRSQDVAYVDGFSGPWESKAKDFSDTSFMIAISVLRDAQQRLFETTGKRNRVRCFFSEKARESFVKLEKAVQPFNKPEDNFEIVVRHGEFTEFITEILNYIAGSFPLIFIDPTGWTGYPLEEIKSLFLGRRCEVLINFMYDYINRFSRNRDEESIKSFAPILGGTDWPSRLNPHLKDGLAVEKLFRETLKSNGNFEFVVSTRIDKPTKDRPHFFIVYGTKSLAGLKAFRDIEYSALRQHEKSRSLAKSKKRAEDRGMEDMFSNHQAEMQEASFEEIVEEQKNWLQPISWNC